MGPLGDIKYNHFKNKTRQGILGTLNLIYRGQNNAIRAADEQREAEINERNKHISDKENLRNRINAKRLTPLEAMELQNNDDE